MAARRKKAQPSGTYQVQEWIPGESRVTADRMNHIEKGIAESHARLDMIEEQLKGLEAAAADDEG